MSVLEFDKVSYRYPGDEKTILDNLSFAVEPGSFHCILGVSGCGKSTIFRLTNGLLHQTEGRVLVGGEPVGGRRHVCGYMPQKDLQFAWRTVGENLALPMEIRGGIPKKEKNGDKNLLRSSVAPEARSMYTAVSSTISAGRMVNSSFSPWAAPSNIRS